MQFIVGVGSGLYYGWSVTYRLGLGRTHDYMELPSRVHGVIDVNAEVNEHRNDNTDAILNGNANSRASSSS